LAVAFEAGAVTLPAERSLSLVVLSKVVALSVAVLLFQLDVSFVDVTDRVSFVLMLELNSFSSSMMELIVSFNFLVERTELLDGGAVLLEVLFNNKPLAVAFVVLFTLGCMCSRLLPSCHVVCVSGITLSRKFSSTSRSDFFECFK
jgi:hypothetical protein